MPEAAWCRPDVQGDLCPRPSSREFDQLSQVTRLGSEGLRCRSAVPRDLCLRLSAYVVDQMSHVTRAQVRMPVGSTICPG